MRIVIAEDSVLLREGLVTGYATLGGFALAISMSSGLSRISLVKRNGSMMRLGDIPCI